MMPYASHNCSKFGYDVLMLIADRAPEHLDPEQLFGRRRLVEWALANGYEKAKEKKKKKKWGRK